MRQPKSISCALILAWLTACLATMSLPLLAAEALPPNFILIMADDLGYGDIGPFGSKKNRTPNLDRMAAEGMKLTSFYAAPVCTPSRAQVLTGCYAKRVSLPNVIFPACPIGLNTNEMTVARLLKQRGYATMAIGKWHVGDAPEFLPLNHGFDHYFGLPYSNDMGGEGKKGSKAKRRPPLPLVRDSQVIEVLAPRDQDRLTERYTEEALKFIRENNSRPFFLYFPHTAVHVPIHPGDKFRGQSGQGFYTDWVEELDWSVGQILQGVRELGLAERTLIFFTSDNGPWLTQGTNGGMAGPLRGGKGGTYEGGMREPTIAWWPGKVPAGTTCDAVAGNIDFLPTFVKLAGGSVPQDRKLDGKDLSPLLFGQSKTSPHQALFYFSGNSLQAVRSGPWKLAVARQSENMGRPAAVTNAAGKLQPFMPTLYNLDSDVGERTNVAVQNPDVIKRLQGWVENMNADLGTNKPGPGVRPPGRVTRPTGLWLPGKMPEFATQPLKGLGDLEIGEVLDSEEAPQIAEKAFSISCTVLSGEGIIVAHGGVSFGYALHLSNGKLVFTVRENRQPVAISASQLPAGPLDIQAALAEDGLMRLSVNGKAVASGKASGLISRQPQENFCLGFDDQNPVGDYQGAGRFTGKISELKVVVE